MKLMNGRSTSGIAGFGCVSVSGRRRVPSPPTRTSACISPALASGVDAVAADALVGEACCAQGGWIEEVPTVDDERVRHRPRDLSPVEVPELLPFGDEDRGVSPAQGRLRRVAQLDRRQEL